MGPLHTLRWYVEDTSPGRYFSNSVNGAMSVEDLKRAIVSRIEIQQDEGGNFIPFWLAPSKLTLYRVEVDTNPSYRRDWWPRKPPACMCELDPNEPLGKYWSSQPPSDETSIFLTVSGGPIVRPPTPSDDDARGLKIVQPTSAAGWEFLEVRPPRIILVASFDEDDEGFPVAVDLSVTIASLKEAVLAALKDARKNVSLERAGDMLLYGLSYYEGEGCERNRLDDEHLVSDYWPSQPPDTRKSLILQLPNEIYGPRCQCDVLQSFDPQSNLSAQGGQPINYTYYVVPRDNDSCDVTLPPCIIMETPCLNSSWEPHKVMFTVEYQLALNAVLEFFEHGEYTSDFRTPVLLLDGNPFQKPLFHETSSKPLRRSKIFTLRGNLGTGKRVFLEVVLRLRLEAGLPTLFMNAFDEFYFINEGKTFRFQVDSRQLRVDKLQHLPSTTWCLVNTGPDSLEEVPLYLLNLGLFIIEAASSRGSHFTGPHYPDSVTCTQYMMKPWSLKDILSGRHLQRQVHSERVLANAFAKFGPSAWVIYSKAGDPSAWERQLKEYAQSVTLDALDAAVNETNVLPLEGRISPFLLTLSPGRSRADRVVTIPTEFIATLVSNAIETGKGEPKPEVCRPLGENNSWPSAEPAISLAKFLAPSIEERGFGGRVGAGGSRAGAGGSSRAGAGGSSCAGAGGSSQTNACAQQPIDVAGEDEDKESAPIRLPSTHRRAPCLEASEDEGEVAVVAALDELDFGGDPDSSSCSSQFRRANIGNHLTKL